MKIILAKTLTSLSLVGLGVGAGYLANTNNGAAAAAAAEPDAQVTFDERTLQNLGVVVGEATLSDFVEHRIVQAVIQDAPLNERPVAAPLAGVVQAIAAKPGAVVKSGAGVMTVVRDAIPRPQLALTGDVFKPVSERLHEAFSELRTATSEETIAKKELDRVRRINAESVGAPVVPKQTEIDLGYRIETAKQRIANVRSELEHHGLSTVEIDAVVAGGHMPRVRELWQRVLTVHGLWTAHVKELFAALPPSTRNLPWSIATLGELSASGVVDASLVAAVKDNAAIRTNFATVAGLLQQGQTVARLRWLADQGALASVFELRAPVDAAPDWDVVEVKVRPGQSVAAGQTVAVLHDARTMWLRVQPVGDEVPLVMAAMRDGSRLHARPLVAGVGPELTDVQRSSGLPAPRLSRGTSRSFVVRIPGQRVRTPVRDPGNCARGCATRSVSRGRFTSRCTSFPRTESARRVRIVSCSSRTESRSGRAGCGCSTRMTTPSSSRRTGLCSRRTRSSCVVRSSSESRCSRVRAVAVTATATRKRC